VFSPYYAWRRRSGPTDPLQHCALNVALYGAGKRWAMTERNAARVHRTGTVLAIGPSALHWDGETLVFDIDERTMPFAGHVSGTIRVRPQALTGRTFLLDSAGQHRWSPLSPRAHVDVALQHPALQWSGSGYLDSNDGDVPLEQSFASWNWCRGAIGNETAILYEVSQRGGTGASLALRVDQHGGITDIPLPPQAVLPPTMWRVPRGTRADGGTAHVRQTLEDTPFYARSVLDTQLLGQPLTAMHESLSLDRFRMPWVQAMLPFRMPRVAAR
jgi:carotenoid 1,2-hydratase